ncbi:hypothetical protein DXG01_006383 [Tephrocybe rancida]|nr:hypothetical protein DXG01_006383 [Tephrocybe rancida]
MAPTNDEDWSDSDDDVGSDVETSVLLGVPDGVVQSDTDISDAAVSRIGGHPVRAISSMPFFLRVNPLSLRPSAKFVQIHASFSYKCGVHSKTAPWIVPSMSGVAPSLRARLNQAGEAPSPAAFPNPWRGLRRNDKYAAKLEIKLAKRRAAAETKAQARALAEQQKNTPKKNPFSVCRALQ